MIIFKNGVLKHFTCNSLSHHYKSHQEPILNTFIINWPRTSNSYLKYLTLTVCKPNLSIKTTYETDNKVLDLQRNQHKCHTYCFNENI